MAKQHFYSRVPFKMSMFNMVDGYDTFAVSKGVERAFIDAELAPVCETKPSPDDAALIRTGELPPVYFQYSAKDGSLIQSCVTNIPLDYTGERSSYMVHSIIFSDQEAESLFCSPDRLPLNPGMFDHDIGHFNVTSPSAKPLTRYPDLEYKCLPDETPQWLVDTFTDNLAMLQRLIYATVASACGVMKGVFILLPKNDTDLAIKYFNTLYSVLPYHLRPGFSFVSRVTDAGRYPSFKLKFLPGLVQVPVARGAFFNLKSNQVTGLKDEHVGANAQIVDFIYNMLANDGIRREFLFFADKAVKKEPSLGQANLKTLQNLIFMFRATSGLFDEKTVLPTDDKLTEFFLLYEKYREALPNEFRMAAAKTLQRYPASHTAIPKQLFSKLSKLYPTEPPGVKHIIMSVVLELIHMDIMRDRLFAFVKSNYAGQDQESKEEIVSNLGRVFYGGFLQQQLIVFFEQIFFDASEASQEDLTDKMLLSIRNDEIRDKIVSFFKSGFSAFSPEIRHKIYSASLEHIKIGDGLAAELVSLVDANIESESEEEIQWFDQRLTTALKNELRKKTHPMLSMLATRRGHCPDLILSGVYNNEYGPKAFTEAVAANCTGSVKDVTAAVSRILPLLPSLGPKVRTKLYSALDEARASEERVPDILSAIEAEQFVEDRLSSLEKGSDEAVFWTDYSEKYISGSITGLVQDVFRYPDRPELFEAVSTYVESREDLKESDIRALLAGYSSFAAETAASNLLGMMRAFEDISENPACTKFVGSYIKKNLLDSGVAATPESRTALLSLINLLNEGSYNLPAVYETLRDAEKPDEAAAPAKKKKGPDEASLKAVKLILGFCNTVGAIGSDKQREAIFSEGSSLNAVFNSFMGAKKNGEMKILLAEIDSLTPLGNSFAVKARQIVAPNSKMKIKQPKPPKGAKPTLPKKPAAPAAATETATVGTDAPSGSSGTATSAEAAPTETAAGGKKKTGSAVDILRKLNPAPLFKKAVPVLKKAGKGIAGFFVSVKDKVVGLFKKK